VDGAEGRAERLSPLCASDLAHMIAIARAFGRVRLMAGDTAVVARKTARI
jgi:hypothetical protein